LVPVHAPEATQDVASVDDQVSVEDPPLVIDVGLAASDTVGTGAGGAPTVTVVEVLAVPPSPVHASPNVAVPVSAPLDWLPEVVLVPVHAPDATQEVALAEDQVRVEDAPLVTDVGLAISDTVGTGGVTVTVAEALPVPPAPVQASVNVPVLVSAPLDWLPEVVLVPVHAPEATQEVALAEDQVRVEDAPLETDVGIAVSDTVGTGGVTVTVAEALPDPPGPVQASVNVPVLVSAPLDWLPEVVLVPVHAPEARHEVALVEDQVRVEAPPLVIDVGLAVSDTVGAGGTTVTVTEALPVPPGPAQARVNVPVLVKAPLDWLPKIVLGPDQAPIATQEAELFDDQVSVEDPPLATDVGLAVRDTVGAGGLTVTVAEALPVPPAPVQARVNVLVLVSAPLGSLPEIVLVLVHAPEAAQEAASVEDQVRVEDSPLATDGGLAASDTVGAGGVEPAGTDSACSAPPHAANATASRDASSSVFNRDVEGIDKFHPCRPPPHCARLRKNLSRS
jgi:hypothetical protein